MDKRPQISDMTPDIQLDLNRERLREIVDEALRMTKEYMGDYTRTKEEIVKDLDKFLNNRMISTMFFLKVGCDKIPDLQFRIDPRRRKILGISRFKKKVASLNHLLRVLG